MTYLYLYRDVEADEQYLLKSLEHLLWSYTIRVAERGKESLSVAMACSNLASVFLRQKRHNEALQLAEESLQTRLMVYGGDRHIGTMISFDRITEILLDMYFDTHEKSYLSRAHDNNEMAYEIALHLYLGAAKTPDRLMRIEKKRMLIREELSKLGEQPEGEGQT